MAIDGNVAVTVTPAHVQVFDLTLSEDGRIHHSELRRTLQIQHSVGFVDVAFRVPDAFTSTTKATPSLRLFISGENGLFAFVIRKDELLLEKTDLELFLVWHLPAVEPPPGQIPEQDKAALEAALFVPYPYMDYSEPQFGTDCTSVSWIEGPCVVASAEYPINLVMLTSRLVQSGIPPATDAYYRIDGMKEVAFYAMAARNYDDGLGLLAIGNAFGELALYSLLPFEDLAAVYDALEDVPIPAYMPEEDTLPVSHLSSIHVPISHIMHTDHCSHVVEPGLQSVSISTGCEVCAAGKVADSSAGSHSRRLDVDVARFLLDLASVP